MGRGHRRLEPVAKKRRAPAAPFVAKGASYEMKQRFGSEEEPVEIGLGEGPAQAADVRAVARAVELVLSRRRPDQALRAEERGAQRKPGSGDHSGPCAREPRDEVGLDGDRVARDGP